MRDGADRGYFTDDQCRPVLVTGNRCGAALMALWRSLQPFIDRPPRKSR